MNLLWTISVRLRLLRKVRHLSQCDVERLTGLRQCHISRIENGFATPDLKTLEQIAQALRIPLYYIFYKIERTDQQKHRDPRDWASEGRGLRHFTRLRHALGRLSDVDRALLLFLASEMASSKRRKRNRKNKRNPKRRLSHRKR